MFPVCYKICFSSFIIRILIGLEAESLKDHLSVYYFLNKIISSCKITPKEVTSSWVKCQDSLFAEGMTYISYQGSSHEQLKSDRSDVYGLFLNNIQVKSVGHEKG